MATIKFQLREDRILGNGMAPIRLIYTHGGPRKYFPVDRYCPPINWDPEKQCAIFISRKQWSKELAGAISFTDLLPKHEVDNINDRLDELKLNLKNIARQFELDKTPFTANDALNRLKKLDPNMVKPTEPKRMVYDFIDHYISAHETLRQPGSMVVYKALKNHLKNFEAKRKAKVTFETIDSDFFTEFQKYLLSLRTKRKDGTEVPLMGNITAAKQLSTLKTFLGYAKRKHKINVNPDYRDFTIERKDSDLEVIALTEHELDLMLNAELPPRLDAVRNVFLIAASTGLRFSDLQKLEWYHISGDEIRMTVTKTQKPITIPLNEISIAIFRKHIGLDKPLQVISNTKTNKYLKEAAKLAGICDPIVITRYHGAKVVTKVYEKWEKLSIHCGRKTFVQLSLQRGVPAQTVMAASGHKDYKSFKRYFSVLDQTKKDQLQTAWGKPVGSANMKIVKNG